MGENSKIAWTHHTFNPWVGCQRVSPGCEHCYAEAYDKRVGGAKVTDVSAGVSMTYKALRWGPKAPRVRTSAANWRKPLAWNKAAAAAGVRHRVFCASLADVFEDRPELVAWRGELLEVIRTTPHLDWLLLTKRPENIRQMLQEQSDRFVVSNELDRWLTAWLSGRPPENVWLGTTVEDQRRAEERVPHLVAMPATVRFLSCEPLLEALDLDRWLDEDETGFVQLIHWVIIGGESGPGARPFDLRWARDLIGQCRGGGRAEASPFVKQVGSNPNDGGETLDRAFARLGEGGPPRLLDRAGADPFEWPLELRVREFPR